MGERLTEARLAEAPCLRTRYDLLAAEVRRLRRIITAAWEAKGEDETTDALEPEARAIREEADRG